MLPRDHLSECLGCPIYEITGQKNCEGSPYPKADAAWDKAKRTGSVEDEKAFKAAARKMFKWLLIMYPYGDFKQKNKA